MRPRILLDVDNVLLDFYSAAIKVISEVTGTRYVPEDGVGCKDVFDLAPPEYRAKCREVCHQAGWCLSIEPYPGAQDTVRKLRGVGDILFVTKPFNSPFWVCERTQALENYFGATGIDQIVYTDAKYAVSGDLFLDDSPENVRVWQEHNHQGVALLCDHIRNRQESQLKRVHLADVYDLAAKVEQSRFKYSHLTDAQLQALVNALRDGAKAERKKAYAPLSKNPELCKAWTAMLSPGGGDKAEFERLLTGEPEAFARYRTMETLLRLETDVFQERLARTKLEEASKPVARRR